MAEVYYFTQVALHMRAKPEAGAKSLRIVPSGTKVAAIVGESASAVGESISYSSPTYDGKQSWVFAYLLNTPAGQSVGGWLSQGPNPSSPYLSSTAPSSNVATNDNTTPKTPKTPKITPKTPGDNNKKPPPGTTVAVAGGGGMAIGLLAAAAVWFLSKK